MCEYCEARKEICNNRNDLGIELHAGKCKLVAYGLDEDNWDISVSCNINYCPMCGQRLSGYENKEEEIKDKFGNFMKAIWSKGENNYE